VVVHSLTSVGLTIHFHFGLRVNKGVLVLVRHSVAPSCRGCSSGPSVGIRLIITDLQFSS
jgi:hypothetical protein